MKRRDFLKSSGALIVAFSHRPARLDAVSRAEAASTAPVRRSSTRGSRLPRDGSVTAYTGKVELGHGLYTAQTQLVAEELSRAALAREADSGRHGRLARSGDDVRQPVASGEFQRRRRSRRHARRRARR